MNRSTLLFVANVFKDFCAAGDSEVAARCRAEAAERERLAKPMFPPPDPARACPKVKALLDRYKDLPEQRSDAWFRQRENKITASNVARIVGEDRHYSAKRYFEERAGMRRVEPMSDFVKQMLDHGVVNEARALAQYQRDPRYGAEQKCIFDFGLCVHPEIGWLAGSPDGITEDGILLEVKCPATRTIVSGEVPLHYQAQVQVLLEIFDLEEAHFIQWKPTEFDVTVVRRDRDWFNSKALPMMTDFWENLQRALEKTLTDDVDDDPPVTPATLEEDD